jgi:hypothetical protein
MELKRGFKLSLLLLFFMVSYGIAAINFGDRRSAIKIADGSKLNVKDGLTITEGTLLRRDATGSVVDGAIITFDGGVLYSEESESVVTADYDPTGDYDIIKLEGNESLKAEPGMIYQNVQVSGVNNKLEGQPIFYDDIVMQDIDTILLLGLQSKLNKNITMNSGIIQLIDDLKLEDSVQLRGPGIVRLNNKQIQFGGADYTWLDSIYWDHATDMVLNAKMTLNDTWTFEGESHVAGNGNTLDLNGKKIWIKHDTTLHLKDIKLRGLGTGSIVFETESSEVRFSDSEIEMDDDYTVTEGGVYIDGESTIYVKDHILTFDQNGSMTVDGCCLWYDLIKAIDHVTDIDSIKPVEADDLGHSKIEYLNYGIIRRVVGEKLGPIVWSGVDYLHDDIWLSPDNYAIVVDDKVVLGRSHSIHFSRTSDSVYMPLLRIDSGKSLTLLNTVFENFLVEHLNLGTDASITFSDHTTIELANDTELNMTFTFIGDCIIKGKGHTLKLGQYGNIVVQKSDVEHSSLWFEDITLEGVSGNKIRCMDNTGTISLSNVLWNQDANYSFTVGHIDVVGPVVMRGETGNVFAYETNEASKIWQDSSLKLDTGFTFSYAPNDRSQRELIQLADETSIIYMNGAILRSTKAGLALHTGTLVLDHKNELYNEDSSSDPATDEDNEAVAFGWLGTDLNIEIMPGGSIDLKTGILDYGNNS